MNQRIVILLRAASAASLLAGAGGALAPALAQEAQAGPLVLPDVVVTARKREERLLDAPLTITAVTSEKIADAGITNIQQLTQFTPGFSFDNVGSRQGSSARVRGLDINTANPTRQNASFFIDGVFYPGSVQGLDFSSLERVEVVKGPQSALFGRQTFGDAVNFVSKTPGNDLDIRAGVTLGERDLREFTASASVPVVADRLFLRASLRDFTTEGPFTNSVDGRSVGDQSSTTFQVALVARPFDWLDATVRYINMEDEDGPPASAMLGAGDLNCGPFGGGTFRFYCGAIPARARFALNSDAAPNVQEIDAFGFTRDADLVSLQTSAELFGHTLTLTAARYTDDNRDVGDLDLTGINRFATVTYQTFEDDSVELKLTSPADQRLRYIVGAYAYEGRFTSNAFTTGSFTVLAGNLTGLPAFASRTPDIFRAVNAAYFASVTLDVLENLSISGELRYQIDKVVNTAGQGATRRTLAGKTDATLPRLIIDWKPTENLTVYGIYSEGNKPKQFNANIAGLTAAQQDFVRTQFGVGVALEEETLENLEVGVKGRFLDGRVTATAAAYQMQWDNQITRRQVFPSAAQQAAGTGQLDAVANAGSSEITGVEIEANAALTDAWTLGAAFAWTDATYTVFNSVNNQQALGNANAAGKVSPRFPDYAGSLSATYRRALWTGWEGSARFDMAYKGKRFTDEVNLAWADGYWLSNLRLTAENERFRVSLFAENLFDELAVANATRFRDTSIAGNQFSFPYGLTEPRRIGASMQVKF